MQQKQDKGRLFIIVLRSATRPGEFGA